MSSFRWGETHIEGDEVRWTIEHEGRTIPARISGATIKQFTDASGMPPRGRLIDRFDDIVEAIEQAIDAKLAADELEPDGSLVIGNRDWP